MILMYTSGTTGAPKGALLPHRKTLFNCLNAELFFGLRRDDRVLAACRSSTPSASRSCRSRRSTPAARWCSSRASTPSAVWRAVAASASRFFGGVPTMFSALLDALDASAPDARALRFLFTAGAAIPVELIRAFAARGLVLKQGFGQTETSILCCLDAADAMRKAGSVGRPVLHAELRIVRSESLAEPARAWRDGAAGETGEIVVRGPITMLGYWNRPEETAETLREGWLRTGDLGRFDAEGFVTLVGRARELYISGGENVYPAEVEAVYAEHPEVREVAVVGVPDPRWGEVGPRVRGLRPGARSTPRRSRLGPRAPRRLQGAAAVRRGRRAAAHRDRQGAEAPPGGARALRYRPSAFARAATTRSGPSFGRPGYIGKPSSSRAARSATGKLPAPRPRSANAGCRCSGRG